MSLVGINKKPKPVPQPKTTEEALEQLKPFMNRLTEMMQQVPLDADSKCALTVMVAANFFGASVTAMMSLQPQFKGMMPSVVGGLLSKNILQIIQQQDMQWTSPNKSVIN